MVNYPMTFMDSHHVGTVGIDDSSRWSAYRRYIRGVEWYRSFLVDLSHRVEVQRVARQRRPTCKLGEALTMPVGTLDSNHAPNALAQGIDISQAKHSAPIKQANSRVKGQESHVQFEIS
jgi:hypothetical protein